MKSGNKDSPNRPLILLLGTTASGKTRLAVNLAQTFSGEIISVDSRQVYRRMDIGTGKDLVEYGDIPAHLIDIIEPETDYSLFDFARDFGHSLEDIYPRGKIPFAVGGTGLYLDALLNRYAMHYVPENPLRREELKALDQTELEQLLLQLAPQQHNTSDLKNRERTLRAIEIAEALNSPVTNIGKDANIDQEASIDHGTNHAKTLRWPEFTPLILGLKSDRDASRIRITARLKQRFADGMVEEVKQLQQHGLSWERLAWFGLEYRYIGQYIQGQLNYNDMFQKLNSAIHEFARQQEKWFRRMERDGHLIHWLPVHESNALEAKELIDVFLNLHGANEHT